jgi:hypothetical protein
MLNNTPLEQRLVLRSTTDPVSGCILMDGALVYGYGQINANGKVRRAHRVAWTLVHGEIPKGMCVCHSCDVRNCINVDHLFLGTQGENLADMRLKGRRHYAKGVFCLTYEQVAQIRVDTRSARAIAQEYGVSHTTINKVRAALSLAA